MNLIDRINDLPYMVKINRYVVDTAHKILMEMPVEMYWDKLMIEICNCWDKLSGVVEDKSKYINGTYAGDDTEILGKSIVMAINNLDLPSEYKFKNGIRIDLSVPKELIADVKQSIADELWNYFKHSEQNKRPIIYSTAEINTGDLLDIVREHGAYGETLFA